MAIWMKKNMECSRRLAVALAMAASITAPLPAMAQADDLANQARNVDAFRLRHEVSDATLSSLRGRYASNGDLLYFGVEMYTDWQTRDGRQLTAGLVFATDAKLRPTVTVVTSGTATGAGQSVQAAGSTTLNLGGVRNISGAAQSIQIGGIGNSVKNDVNMNINLHADQLPASPGGNMNKLPVTASGTQVFNNAGTTTTVSIGKDGLSLGMNVPGQGSALQQLRNGLGLLQAAQVGGDLNLVHNIVNINAGLRMPTGFESLAVSPALNSIKSMQRLGF